ncbi:MAG: HRDC domain-containing protein [Proteobacteria bacterium]|nr:HRDC domain-containing protein [Pseudomonadota bacterium]MBU1389070.1 HRDC domain-containing protein [Pseudomonadota bacterium]MBU1543623.1 HRDC domain-containing protein [Pseudomonadota bacterium]MBU2479827.1 HRDC domain-containing protein [Pseudomonadota bacterium]
MDYKFIESDKELETVCESLLEETIIGVDLEADSMHCFNEKICLIQIATANQAYLIDPFKIKDLTCFTQVLESANVKKIFHGADFDVRSLDRDYGVRMENLFDTEIACRFLGIKERGLGALIKKYFDVDLDKRFQKEDWSARPLKKDMIEYSVGDVTYLIRLHDIIHKRLSDCARLSWADEEFEIQSKVRYENNHTAPLFLKFKGAGKMDNRALAALENLLQVRLDIARKKDKPLFMILSSQTVADLAAKRPETVEQMVKSRLLSPKQAQMYGQACVDAIVSAVNLSHGQLPSYPKTRRSKPDLGVKERTEQLKKMREKLSMSLGIEPGFLLNNTMISVIAVQNPTTLPALSQIENIRQWQVTAIGQDILNNLGYCRS